MSGFIIGAEEVVCGCVEVTSTAVKLESEPCVYFLLKGEKIIYIGKTVNLSRRIAQHTGKDFDSVSWVVVSDSDLSQAELVNIDYHDPELNKYMPDMQRFNESITARQIHLIADHLNIKPITAQGCELVLIGGLTAYEAEKRLSGRRTGTVSRVCKTIQDEMKYIRLVASQATPAIEAKVSDLYLAEAGLLLGCKVDSDGDILVECGRVDGNINKDEAERLVKHLTEVFGIKPMELDK